MALITEAQLNMANLNEEPVWEEGIYQFETTDPVEGGTEGIDNKPTRQLANRTAYLKKEQDKLKDKFDAEKTPNPLPQYMRFGDEASCWASMPIGVPFPLIGDMPPSDDRYRYIVLTDADLYNDGVLINKEVSGAAPNLVIKYTIDMPGSPLNGAKIEMLNTMEAVMSPSVTNSKIFNDTIRNFTGSFFATFGSSNTFTVATHGHAGVLRPLNSSLVTRTILEGVATNQPSGVAIDASLQVPTGVRNQTFAVGAKYVMRIK
ncbi:hypothetical protein RDG67_001426 [Vibrio cholerae]|nr:hypothetical protein [Vibrio cholerae]